MNQKGNSITYLPGKGQEVHDVIQCGGVLDVATVDVHSVPELVAPAVMTYAQGVHVHVGQVHQTAHHTVEV